MRCGSESRSIWLGRLGCAGRRGDLRTFPLRRRALFGFTFRPRLLRPWPRRHMRYPGGNIGVLVSEIDGDSTPRSGNPFGSARQGFSSIDSRRIRRLRRLLSIWARTNKRHFFWRRPDVTPFQVLVTEILLSKTRAEVVEPIARLLFRKYTGPAQLARAKPRTLEKMLYPLGLHRKRARGLVACAMSLLEDHRGGVPGSVMELLKLPSVGRYVATATASVAFHQHLAVVDANVARIYQRVFSLPEKRSRLSTDRELWALAQCVLPRGQAREFNWAILDLGGTVCTAKRPACDRCPLAAICDARAKQRNVASDLRSNDREPPAREDDPRTETTGSSAESLQ